MRVIATLCLLLLALPGYGHSRGETWSYLKIGESDVQVTYTMAAPDLAQHLPALAHSGDLDKAWPVIASKGLALIAGNKLCNVKGLDFRHTLGVVEASWTATCESTDNLVIRNDALFDRLPNHLHIVRAQREGGEMQEKLMTRRDRDWALAVPVGTLGSFTEYLALGIEHIATGFDHLAFLFAVMLLSPRLITLLLMITGFTIGHSITLVLAVLGYVQVDGGAVEALIGFTIALVAAEVVAKRHGFINHLAIVTGVGMLALIGSTLATPAIVNITTLAGIGVFSICYLALSQRTDYESLVQPTLTLLFGMIHGFGFAGLLTEVGLPAHALIPALLGFNLGVELGQLTILAVVGGVAWLMARQLKLPWYLPDGISSALCGLGIFLFVTRSFA